MTTDRRLHPAAEDGQTLVVAMLFLVALLAFAGVVIDGGNFFVVKRNLQGGADAAALAGGQDLGSSQYQASQTATQYVTDNFGNDKATVKSITFSGSKMTVTLQRKTDGSFLKLLGQSSPTITASATVQYASMAASAGKGFLPMAFMRDSYTLGTNSEVKFDGNATGNRGAISPNQNPPTCSTSNGANDFRALIEGSAHGGVDACAYDFGQTVSTEPGNMSGPTRQGLDQRIPSTDHDGFSDIFEYDASTGRYIVKKPNSPRIGLVPVIENTNGTTTWPNGKKDVRVVGYVMVYIGNTSQGGNPAYTNNGKSVWVTPVQAMLPKDFSGSLTDYDSSRPDLPTAIHLVS